jgi:outer membrane lipopolysaccharide assembly protein LptE/RlpB
MKAAVKLSVAIALLLSLAGCGYSLSGRGSSVPTTIKTIGVPLFENATPVFDLEQALTEKVRLELISRGKFRVMPDATTTDAVLTGQITNVTITPTAYNQNQQASRYAFTMVVKVEFRDVKANRVLYENSALNFREEYEVTTGSNLINVTDFLGQNGDAKERMVNDFARTVVSSILEAF